MLRTKVGWIEKNVRGQVILDVGFASKSIGHPHGYIHEKICDKNPGSLIVGVDIDRDLVSKHRIRYGDKSHLVAGDGFKLPFKDAVFDALFLGQIIEHVWEPLALFRECFRVLREDGMLYLTTPNLFGFTKLGSYVHKGWYGVGGEHTLLFDAITLKNMLLHIGFKDVKWETLKCFIPVPFLNRRIRLSTNFPLFSGLGYHLCLIAKT